MLRIGDTIEYIVDVSSPPDQKGIRGQTKIIDRDIDIWTANFLLRGGRIRLYDPASPLQLEEKKTKEDSDGPAEHSEPASVADTKVKKERRTKTNGQRKSTSKRNQTGDHGHEKPDPKRRGGCRGG